MGKLGVTDGSFLKPRDWWWTCDCPGVWSSRDSRHLGARALCCCSTVEMAQGDSCHRHCSQFKGLGECLCAESSIEPQEREGPCKKGWSYGGGSVETGGFLPGMGWASMLSHATHLNGVMRFCRSASGHHWRSTVLLKSRQEETDTSRPKASIEQTESKTRQCTHRSPLSCRNLWGSHWSQSGKAGRDKGERFNAKCDSPLNPNPWEH